MSNQALNPHTGHRNRMRERFRLEGLDGFAYHEALELLLFTTRTRGNVNPLAHDLLEAFGSFKGVLEATPEQLMTVKGVGEETATLLSLIVPLMRKYEQSVCEQKIFLHNKCEVEAYCRSMLVGLKRERFFMICLSPNMTVVGQRVIGDGAIGEVPAYPRVVVETALNYNASAVILCHNHPGGDALPSYADLDVTCRLFKALDPLGIRLVDHIIVADSKTYSMCQAGDQPFDFDKMTPAAEIKGRRRI